ncbi:MAG: hypothetical protein KDC28_06155 [Saprospiraceae bacterium]|nr:hypothetical protein [Saprospiraceae bacterium]MCB9317754.1 hypothetical protein [Lewinellaceae bacterium]
MKTSWQCIVVAGSLLIAALGACKEQDRPLDARTRIYVDTLVEQALHAYQPEADSLCAMRYDSIYQWAFDSIMEIRLEQKRALMQYGDVQ